VAKGKADGKAGRARFRKGDRVSFLFGAGAVTGQVIEDRGRLGVGGRRLYGIRFEINPGEPAHIEMPEERVDDGGRRSLRPIGGERDIPRFLSEKGSPGQPSMILTCTFQADGFWGRTFTSSSPSAETGMPARSSAVGEA